MKVILISHRWQTLDPEMIRIVGIEPAAERILVVKSTIHYRAAFEPIAARIIEVDAPGLSSSNLDRFAFTHVRRPDLPARRPLRRRRTHGLRRLRRRRLQGLRREGVPAAHGRDPHAHPPEAGDARARASPPPSARSLGGETFAHVARHARRTVNPPDDTWVAFGPDARGYKKHCHFKVAVSRHCVRFLFEIGPEHADKKRWAAAWKKNAPQARARPPPREGPRVVQERARRDAAGRARRHDAGRARRAGDEIMRTRDGQLVLGRAVAADEAARWTEAQYRQAALDTFRALVPLYRLR